MGRIQLFSFILLVCAVLETALGRATNAVRNLGITGGHTITIQDAPFMAGLLDAEGHACGGSIVHERFVLTSAYCVQVGQPIERVHVGSRHVSLHGRFILIDKALCHEDYNEHTFENDICLLKLSEPVPFSPTVAKVQLPAENSEIADWTTVNVTGWGNEAAGDQDDSYPTFLQQASIYVFSKHACRYYEPEASDTMLCAGWEGRDACNGDAGGPLTVNNVQVGIVSFGPPKCGHEPSFYTKVSKYITWINNKITNNLNTTDLTPGKHDSGAPSLI